MVVRPPSNSHYHLHQFVQLLLLVMFYELLPFFFMPNQIFVEHNMANATIILMYLRIEIKSAVFGLKSIYSLIVCLICSKGILIGEDVTLMLSED